ncbi:MAG: hypothetical protein MJD61_22225 [Proteobacteria bacterium]|nr:hypothetical protein [Pseudomonadota bacterium]
MTLTGGDVGEEGNLKFLLIEEDKSQSRKRSSHLSQLLTRTGNVVIPSSFHNAFELLDRNKSVLAVIVYLTGQTFEIEIVQALRKRKPAMPMLLFSSEPSARLSHEAAMLDLPYVLEPIPHALAERLAQRAAMRNATRLGAVSAAAHMMACQCGLTPRQHQLVSVVANGTIRRRGIAQRLNVTENTAKGLIREVLFKTGCKAISDLHQKLAKLYPQNTT